MEVSEPEQNESPKAKDLANESAYWRGRFHGELRSQTFIGLVSPDWRREQDGKDTRLRSRNPRKEGCGREMVGHELPGGERVV